MSSKEIYQAAEASLIDWVETSMKSGLRITDIAFLLQFRVFDINMRARVVLDEEPKVGGTD